MHTYRQILKGHRAFFNVDTGKYEAEKEKTPVCLSLIDKWFEDYESANSFVQKSNEELENGTRAIIKCVDCGAVFELQPSEVDWYKEKGFVLPKRCFVCRNQRKDRHHKGD